MRAEASKRVLDKQPEELFTIKEVMALLPGLPGLGLKGRKENIPKKPVPDSVGTNCHFKYRRLKPSIGIRASHYR